MRKFLLGLISICCINVAFAETYQVESADRTASEVLKRWVSKDKRKVVWDVTTIEPKSGRVLSVEFDILDAAKINNQITNKQDFKSALVGFSDYFTNTHKDIYFSVCYYTEGEIAVWVNSSHNLKCDEVYEALEIKNK